VTMNARQPFSTINQHDIKIDSTVIIEGDVVIGEGVEIEPFSIIKGNVVIGNNTYISSSVRMVAIEGKIHIGNNCKVSSGTTIHQNVTIGDNTFIGHNTIIRPMTKIGNHVSIGSLNQIEGHCSIGDYTRTHSNVHISMKSKIGEHCFIAPGFVPTNTPYPLGERCDDFVAGVTVESHVKIGANVTTAPGVIIRKNSLIGFGSVVTEEIPANSVAFGNPCKVKRRVDEIKYPNGEKVYSLMDIDSKIGGSGQRDSDTMFKYQGAVIDFHVHCGKFPQWDLGLSLSEAKQLCEEENIKKMIVLSDLQSSDLEPEKTQQLLIEASQSESLLPFHWVNIHPSATRKDIIRQINYIEKNKHYIKGLKYHPSISQVSCDDKRIQELWEYANQEKYIVLIHSGRNEISHGKYLDTVARCNRDAVWVLAHLGGGVFDRIMECIYYYDNKSLPDNLYFDTSQTTHPVLLKRLVEHFGDQNVLFGSDVPFLDYKLVKYCVLASGLRESSLERIFYKNARSLLIGKKLILS